MKTAIIGYPFSGKTTIFEALGGSVSGNQKNNIKNIKVPDSRLNKLSEMYEPKKTTPAEITVIDIKTDINFFNKKNSIFEPDTINILFESDVIVMVVRDFKSDNVPVINNSVDTVRDFQNIYDEICFLDLMASEKRLERLEKENNVKSTEYKTIKKVIEHLQDNIALYNVDLSQDELNSFSGYKFLSLKKIILLVNTDEDKINDSGIIQQLTDLNKKYNVECQLISASVENEITQLDDVAEQQEFLKEFGLSEPVSHSFLRKVYKKLNLISFFTVGSDEVKAWTIKKGTLAVKAAGCIHSDIERGFIRAEIVKAAELIEKGSYQELKKIGSVRLEGKDYIVEDGDVINFRFNV